MNNLNLGLTLDALLLATPQLPTDKAFRIVLLPGELFRIPVRNQELRILSGSAWVSLDGTDYEVNGGENLPLRGARHSALISDAKELPLVFEIL